MKMAMKCSGIEALESMYGSYKKLIQKDKRNLAQEFKFLG